MIVQGCFIEYSFGWKEIAEFTSKVTFGGFCHRPDKSLPVLDANPVIQQMLDSVVVVAFAEYEC